MIQIIVEGGVPLMRLLIFENILVPDSGIKWENYRVIRVNTLHAQAETQWQ